MVSYSSSNKFASLNQVDIAAMNPKWIFQHGDGHPTFPEEAPYNSVGTISITWNIYTDSIYAYIYIYTY